MWKLIKPIFQFILKEAEYQKFRRLILVFLINFGYSNSLKRMDKKIIELFSGKENGFFIEVGAADGVDQSNTLLLERKYGWTGLLIEPISEQFGFCKKVRKNSIVEHCCLVSLDNRLEKSNFYVSNLTSRVVTNAKAEEINQIETVNNNNLDNLLKKYNIETVDIMSLDVEGYEISVLDGYNDEKNIIEYLLVETWDFDKFFTYAKNRNWQYICRWGVSDFLFKLK